MPENKSRPPIVRAPRPLALSADRKGVVNEVYIHPRAVLFFRERASLLVVACSCGRDFVDDRPALGACRCA